MNNTSLPKDSAKVHLFAGPTLSRTEIEKVIVATTHPPVKQGDLLRLCHTYQVDCIGIIDGTFERQPAIWHKEILWALEQGIRVYGAASMGALRAVELAEFGMIGVGHIYQQFSEQRLEDDDEVAVTHATDQHNYIPTSEAMVNIRSTLNLAQELNLLSTDTVKGITAEIKALHYSQRNYDAVFRVLQANNIEAHIVEKFRLWLSNNRCNQKKKDSLLMLQCINEYFGNSFINSDDNDRQFQASTEARTWKLQNTEVWSILKREIINTAGIDAAELEGPIQLDGLLDELRLIKREFAEVQHQARERSLLLHLASKDEDAVDSRGREQAAVILMDDKGWNSFAEAEQWLQANHIQSVEFEKILDEESLLHPRRERLQKSAKKQIVRVLKVKGLYGQLLNRARSKAQLLAERGWHNIAVSDTDLSEEELFLWFCDLYRITDSHNTLADENPSISSCCKSLEFDHEDTFMWFIAKEYIYLKECKNPD